MEELVRYNNKNGRASEHSENNNQPLSKNLALISLQCKNHSEISLDPLVDRVPLAILLNSAVIFEHSPYVIWTISDDYYSSQQLGNQEQGPR